MILYLAVNSSSAFANSTPDIYLSKSKVPQQAIYTNGGEEISTNTSYIIITELSKVNCSDLEQFLHGLCENLKEQFLVNENNVEEFIIAIDKTLETNFKVSVYIKGQDKITFWKYN